MDAIILAAGLGTRLRPHTEKIPKPLLPIQGRPLLDWIIGALPPIERLLVVVNYLAEQIDDYLKTQSRITNWQTVRQEVPRGTGDALKSCAPYAQSDKIMVLNGDDLFSANDLHRLARHPAGMLAHPVDEPQKFGIVFQKADGSLDYLAEKPALTGTRLANIGAYLFPRKVFDIPLEKSPRGEYEITDAVSQLAKEMNFAVEQATFWFPIGNVPAWEASQSIDLTPCVSIQ